MSQTELDQLIDQLSVGDAKTRRAAAKRLGELGRPEAISELANIYLKDEDKTVRKAAEESLRSFRAMEQKMLAGDEAPKGGASGGMLKRVRTGLIVLLVLSILGNAAVYASKLLPGASAVTPTAQSVITPRDTLVTAFKKRIDDNRGVAVLLRQMYSAVQGMGAQALKVNTPGCEKLQAAQPDKVDLGSLDAVTYPDLKNVNDQINLISLRLLALRNDYVALCTSRDTNEFNKLLGDQGGAAKKVADVDDATNKDLAAADAGLRKAIDQPAPTVGPTNTPTTAPTVPPTVPAIAPTNVPASAAPAGQTTAPGKGTPVAAAPTSAGGGAAATPTAAPPSPVPTYTYKGLQLDQLKSYRYKVAVRADGAYPNGSKFRASLQITANRQNTPLLAQYDIVETEVNIPKDLIKNLAGSLYAPGSNTYIIQDGVLYTTGNVLDTTKPKVQCIAARLNDKNTLADFAMADLSAVPLTLQPGDDTMNDVKVRHFAGEKRGGTNNQFLQRVDVYLSADKQQPIRVIEAVTLSPVAASGGATAVPTGYAEFSLTTQFDLLAQNQEAKVAKPLVCNDVAAK